MEAKKRPFIDSTTRFILLIVCVVADATLNCSRILTLGFDTITTNAWIMIAIACAFAPAIISSYADSRAATIGLISCLASISMSFWAIYGTVDGKKYEGDLSTHRITMYQQELDSHLLHAEKQMELCRKRPAEECDSLALSQELKSKEMDIRKRIDENYGVRPISSFDEKLNIYLLCFVSLFLQVWAAELARQLGQNHLKKKA